MLPSLPILQRRRLALATDGNMLKLEPVKKLISSLGEPLIFSDIQPNPTVANVDRLAKLLKENGAEAVVAIGGGSVIDCAKAASCLAMTDNESIRPFHSGGAKLGEARLPLVAVPTTAGTGSEVTPFAVLDDTERNFKGPMASESFYPVAAVVDPELTLTLPRKATAIGALDALSHSIEGYWSKSHQPICDALALEAAKLIFSNLAKVYENPGDIAGREAISYAALLAGMAFQLPKNAIMHACSFPLSNRFHMPHGAACAFTMEGSIRLNAPYMDGRMERFAAHCGFDCLEGMIASVAELKKSGGLPLTLADAGIGKDDVELLIEESFHPLMKNNPKEVSKEDLRNIYAGLGAAA